MKCKSLLLLFVIIIYLFLGGVLFSVVEEGPRIPGGPMPASFMDNAGLLKKITEKFPEANKTLLMAALGIQPPEIMAMAQTAGDPTGNATNSTAPSVDDAPNMPPMIKLPFHLRLAYWLSYSVTLVTTIGYGHIYPQTMAGKALTLLYGTIGIPLVLLCIVKLGLMFRQTIRGLLYRLAVRSTCLEALLKRHGYFLIEFPIHSILYSVIIVLIPSAVFSSVEGWSFGDSIYFCFVTLTTIGFGDMVNNQPDLGFTLKKATFYGALTYHWIFFGLIWQACVLSIVWSKVMSSPALRNFIGPKLAIETVMETIAMSNGTRPDHDEEAPEENEKLNKVGENKDIEIEQEKLNTTEEEEKVKLNGKS